MATGFKTGGRQKGTPNKVSKEVKEKIADILEAEINEIPELLKQVDANERLNIIIKLLPFVVPKLRHTTEQKEFEEQPLFPDHKEIIAKAFKDIEG